MSEEFDSKIAEILLKEERTPEDEGLLTIEFSKCMGSFLYFLKWAKIADPPTLDTPGGVIPLELWGHLKSVIKSLMTEKLIAVLKARHVASCL